MQRALAVVLLGAASAVAASFGGAASGLLEPAMHAQASAGQTEAPTPLADRAPDALDRVTWRTRTLVGDDRLTHWPLAVRLDDLTFLDAVVRADAAVVAFVDASSTQQVGRDIQKPLDHRLSADEIAAIRKRMGTIRLLTYRLAALAAESTERRQVFEFARAMGAMTIVVPANTVIAGLDTLADEFAVNVAVSSAEAMPSALMGALSGKGHRLGIAIDIGLWAQQGIDPNEAVAAVRDRIRHLNLRDRSDTGPNAKNVRLGQGVGKLGSVFDALERLNVRGVALSLDTAGVLATPGDIFAAVEAFEQVVQPAYGRHFTKFSKSRPIRWDLVSPRDAAKLTADAVARESEQIRRQIVAAVPKQPLAAPKKPRTLLVIESLHGMSHNTIPHTNVMVDQLGAMTGAWTAEFNNDLSNLTYPKIKAYDAVFLNSIVGELFAEPAVREGVARFVREGGGVAGIHGTPWASRNWDEFADMIGAQDAPHRIEKGVISVFDPTSPLVQSLRDKPMTFAEEYYRFRHEGRGRLRWNQVRVLLTVALDDPAIEPRPWTGYTRPDKTYPVSWIRTYGKGRVFYSSLGHMPETFMDPALVSHFFAGLQYVLGDLEADATPNPAPGLFP